MTRMTIGLVASLQVLAGAGCAMDVPGMDEGDDVGVRQSEIKRSELQGYECHSESTPTNPNREKCTKCITVPNESGGGTHEECTAWHCSTVTGDCDVSEWWERAGTFDEDLNFWFEAEAGTLTAPMQKTADGGASKGAAVIVPTTAGSGGSVAFTFELSHDARVYPWARVRTPSTGADSFYAHMDSSGSWIRFDAQTHPSWTWSKVQSSSTSVRTAYDLHAGTHTFYIDRIDAGASLDRVLLTASEAFVPVADRYEAEAAARLAPMQQGTMFGLPSTTYVWVPNGGGTGGNIAMEVPLPVSGHYAVWGRVNAPSGADNSFFVRANFEDVWAEWHTPITTASGWAWAQVHTYGDDEPYTFELDAGYDYLWVAEREDGTRLDKLIVTNDPGFAPVDLGPIVTDPTPTSSSSP